MISVEEKLQALLIVLVLCLTSLGGNNAMYASINNLFLIAPRMFSKPGMSAFENVAFAHRGFFDNENGIPENSLLDIEICRWP